MALKSGISAPWSQNEHDRRTGLLPMRLTWTTVQESYAPDLSEQLARADALGLNCPPDVFEQLFHEQHDKVDLATVLRFVDWTAVTWEEGELSGVALRHAAVPRAFQHAVDEARAQTLLDGFYDERAEVTAHWATARTWIRAPIVLAGEVLQSAVNYEVIVGFTRLGNLLGALDRQDLPEWARHRVWIGRPA
jgi:hypothetical protein